MKKLKDLMRSRVFRITSLFLFLFFVISLLFFNFFLKQSSNATTVINSVKSGKGQEIAIIRNEEDGSQYLESLKEPNQETLKKLTDPQQEGNVILFRWSPDRNYIVYTTSRTAVDPSDHPLINIRLMKSDGSEKQILSQDLATQVFVAVDFASQNIAYTTPTELGIINITTKERKALFKFEEVGAANGTDVLYVPEPFWSKDNQFVTVAIRDKGYFENKTVRTFRVDIKNGKETLMTEGKDSVL